MATKPSDPTQGYSFTDHSINQPTVPQPGDKLDAELTALRSALTQTIDWVEGVLADNGSLKPGVVTPLLLAGENYVDHAEEAATRAELARQEALKWAEYLAGPVYSDSQWESLDPELVPPGFHHVPVEGGSEGLFSAKWWAVKMSQEFGALARFYLGAFRTEDEPTVMGSGEPLVGGALYYNMDRGELLVWNGTQWMVPLTLAPAATQGLVYLASAGQTAFDLSVPDVNGFTNQFTAGVEEPVRVFLNGALVPKDNGTGTTGDWVVSYPANTVTFLSGLTAGDMVQIEVTSMAAASRARTWEFTATEGQTVFTGPDDHGRSLAYSAGATEVFLNGVRLDSADYTAADGSSVTLVVSASAGDLLFVHSLMAMVAVVDPLESKTVIDVRDFGAVGDGVTNDVFAIQAAINYAATLVRNMNAAHQTFGGPVTVDLGGKTYLVSDSVSLDACGGVYLANGSLLADPDTWPAWAPPVVRLGQNTGHNLDRYAGLENLRIECNHVADGVYNQNARTTRATNIRIHGFVNYGLRVFGTNGGDSVFSDVRASQWFYNETGWDAPGARTGVGISSEQADNRFERCEGVYCATPISVEGPGTHIFDGCHPFNGAVPIDSWTITGVADNAGSVRLTVADTTGLVTGDYCFIPYLAGVTDAGGGRGGVYAITVVDSTTVDVSGYAFAGTFDTGTTPNLILWNDEPVVVRVKDKRDSDDAATAGVMFNNCEFDNGKVVVENDARVQFSGCNCLKNGDGYNRVGIEFVSDGLALNQLVGVTVVGTTFTSVPFRLVAINGGSFGTQLKCFVSGNTRTNGAIPPTFGPIVAGEGVLSLPGIIFAEREPIDDGETVVLDTNTGLYHPAADKLGLVAGGVEAMRIDASARACFGGGAIDSFSMGGVSRRVQTSGTGVTSGFAAAVFSPSTNMGGAVALGRSRNTTNGDLTGSTGQVVANDILGQVAFCGHDSSGSMSLSAQVYGVAENSMTSSNRHASLLFRTSSASTPTDRVKITKDGHIIPMAADAYDLGIATTNRWRDLYILNAPTVGSDRRLKNDIADSDLGLDFLLDLKPAKYKLKVSGRSVSTRVIKPAVLDEHGDEVEAEVTEDVVVETPGTRTHYGLVAQDVQATLAKHGKGSDFGGWIMRDKDDPESEQALRYEEFLAPLIRAIQELASRVEALEKAI